MHEQCWDAGRGLLADTPKKDRFSQHANALGILTETITGDDVPAVARKLLAEPADRLAQATFYFRFYLHRALRKAGLGDHYLEWLEPWRKMLAVGLTTWAENPEPTRSDCHAWSAHPNVDLLATVLGVEPAAPGFAKVLVAPHLGKLEWAEGAVPHPRGKVEVKLRRQGQKIQAEVKLPENTEDSCATTAGNGRCGWVRRRSRWDDLLWKGLRKAWIASRRVGFSLPSSNSENWRDCSKLTGAFGHWAGGCHGFRFGNPCLWAGGRSARVPKAEPVAPRNVLLGWPRFSLL